MNYVCFHTRFAGSECTAAAQPTVSVRVMCELYPGHMKHRSLGARGVALRWMTPALPAHSYGPVRRTPPHNTRLVASTPQARAAWPPQPSRRGVSACGPPGGV